jgi:transposase-like protein
MPRADPKTKARAVADLLDGVQPAIVAARYNIPSGTVRSWKARLDLPAASAVATSDATVIRKPAIERAQLEIADLILDNLRAKLIATQRIAEYVTTPDWIDKQNAADMGALFTAIDSATTAILDRMAQRGRSADAADDA